MRATEKGGLAMNYESPRIEEVGSVRELTLGEGWKGSADQLWIFSWGEKPGLS